MTIKINGVELKTVYIDSSLENPAGDGTSPALALNNLPETLADNTCYIMRRTAENHKCRLNAQSTAFTNIALLGMPRKDDSQYWEVMDEAACKAWGEDSAEYAVVEAFTQDGVSHVYSDNNRSSIKTTAIKNFTLLNCYVSRSQNNYSTSSSVYGFNPIFMLNNKEAVINIHGCKFSYFGVDMEKESFRNNPVLPTQHATYLYSCRGDGYGYLNCNILNMTKNVINVYNDMHSSGYAYNDYKPYVIHNGFYVETCHRLVFSHNEVNKAANKEDKNFPAILFYNVTNLSCHHNKLYFVSGGPNSSNFYSALISGNTGITSICSNYGSYRTFKNQKYNVTSGSPFFYLMNVFGLTFNYNSADHGTSTEASPCLLYVGTLGDGVSGLLHPEFKNNYVTGYQEYTTTKNGRAGIYIQNVYPLANQGAWEFREVYARPNLSSRLMMENCVINCPHGTAIYNEFGLQVKNCDVSGLIKLNKCASIDLNSYKNYQANTCGITLSGIQNYIRIRDFWIDKESTNYIYNAGNQISSIPDSQNMVFVDKSNCDLNNTVRSTTLSQTSENCAYICPNKVQSGQYWQISANATCESYNVHRNGSSAKACLKFVNNKTDDPAYPLIVGNEPVKGIMITPSGTGKKLVTAHVAWKNFAAKVNEQKYNQRFVLEVKVPLKNDKGEITHNSYFSDIDGYWEDDAQSTWVNDSDLVQKTINIPVQISVESEPIEIKISHSWYDSTGFVYFDPDIELTTVA